MRASRTLAFLITAVPVGVTGAAVILLGWLLVPLLVITPAVVPVLIGFRAAVGWLAGVEAALVRGLLGVTVHPRTSTPSRRGFWGRALDIFVDGAFAKQQGYLLLRFVLGGALAVGEVVLLGSALIVAAVPVYYHWSHPDWVDTVWKAILCLPAGLAVLLLGWALLRPLRALWVRLAYGLLDSRDSQAVRREELRPSRRRALAIHAAVYVAVNGLLVVIWAATTAGYFWPAWPLIALYWPLAIHAWVELVEEWPGLTSWSRTKALAIHAGIYVASSLFYVFLWLASGGGYFWALWPILAFTLILAGHWIWTLRQGRLEERIEVLETTRAGAVDQQEDERRRIERDLHDGAQARLVALGMSIGLAEQKLDADPEAARELLADAQQGAREALEELRDLARGIHPPVLTDRGLAAAVATLADHNPLQVDVSVELDHRPPAAVETAAYFVAAEALANATKHAAATRVTITIRSDDGALLVEVLDDGKGGADLSGAGLTGLARRVQALDGTLQVTSPAGGPTTLTAELPCAS
ncbi:MAG TPA: sensor histidine kinase [Gaiellaceae bacterium]|jgi:signal transduction histidine kinase